MLKPGIKQRVLGICLQMAGWSGAALMFQLIRFQGLIVLGGNRRAQFDLNALNLARVAQAILNARHREEGQARARHLRQIVRFLILR